MKWQRPAMMQRDGRGSLGVEGAAAVELALTVSVLAILVLGVSDYGALMGSLASLEGATRTGAEYAKVNATDTTGIETQVCGHLGLTLNSGSCSPVTPTASPICTCVDNTWPNGAVCPPPLTGVNPCNVTNPYTNLTDTRVLQYVQVGATRTYSLLVPYASFAPVTSLNAQTTTRAQ
jgi:Flp pilus assembly protein TadG